MPGASEVCVNVHLKAEIEGGIHDDTFIFCKKLVSANSFDCDFVKLCRISTEAGAVVHSHTDVGSCVLGKKIQFADNGTKIPFFSFWWAIGVWVKYLVGRGVISFAVSNSNIVEDGSN